MMRTTVLLPFRVDTNFELTYGWSADLARRLRCKLQLFTSYSPNESESLSSIYKALALAQSSYVKQYKLIGDRTSPVRSERHFVAGEFSRSFNSFLSDKTGHVIVLQSDMFSINETKTLIDSGQKLIILPSAFEFEEKKADNRAEIFITILKDAAVYNMPDSFFKTVGHDTGIFNALTKFFRK